MTSANFRRNYGIPCLHGSYALDPDEDNYYFLENGTILTINSTNPPLITQEDYCLAVIQIDEEISLTLVAVCIPPEDRQPTEFIIFYFLSAVSLNLLFIIYMLLKDLQNIHGMVVRAHVFMLSIGYYALAANNLGTEFSFQYDFICLSFGNYCI